MMRRFFAYLRKVYAFEALLCELRDERRTRHISTAAVCRAVFLMFVLRLGSLNALEQYLRRRASARISFYYRLGELARTFRARRQYCAGLNWAGAWPNAATNLPDAQTKQRAEVAFNWRFEGAGHRRARAVLELQ